MSAARTPSLTTVSISRASLRSNVQAVRDILSPRVAFMAIVKSNAYGHGMEEVVTAIKHDVDWFGVVNIDEAKRLDHLHPGKPLFVMSYYPLDTDAIAWAIRHRVTLPLYCADQLATLERIGSRLRKSALVHLKIDIGTSRIGIRPDALEPFLKILKQSRWVRVVGTFSHFSSSEEDADITRDQIRSFEYACALMRARNLSPGIRHVACSAATIGFPESHFDLVRVGIALYGLWPSEQIRKRFGQCITLTPALRWTTRLIQIKDLKAGTRIGYGGTYRASRRMRLGVLPLGYFEGIRRGLSNTGYVLIRGKKAPVRGRVCMNLFMVDLSRIPSARLGDEVVIIGRQGRAVASAEEMASTLSAINYEIVTGIHPSIPRIVVP